MKARLLKLSIWLAALYAFYLALFAGLQRELVFFGQHLPSVSAQRSGGIDVWLGSGEARVEAAYYRPSPTAAGTRTALLIAHGNRELISWWDTRIEPFVDAGHPVLVFEYPGYGSSGGSPSRDSIGAASTAAFDWLAARPEVDGERIVAMGKSLGGGVVADLSRARPLAGLILQSTFTSLPDLLWESYAIPAWLVRDPFDVRQALRAFGGRVLILHGDHDLVIPERHFDRLRQAAGRSRSLFQACGHADCPVWDDSYWTTTLRFLAAIE